MTGLPNQRPRSFAQADFSYDGTKDYERVETFLTNARKFKSMRNIKDIEALRSLPFILKGDAINWWYGIKHTISTWTDFELQLRKSFAPVKPNYVIFQEIAALRQQPNELTERFVAKKRALFNQLPSPGLAEVVQLDMIYGFLHPKVQEQIPRECIESFEGLLEAAKGIEQEQPKDKPKPQDNQKPAGKKKNRCNFCRMSGHVADVCRKRQRVMAEQAENSSTSAEQESEAPAKRPALSSDDLSKKMPTDSSRPMIEISIGTAKELALVDPGAKTTIASYKLYSYLKNIGFHFQEENTTVTLADGIAKTQDVFTGRVPVKVGDRCVLTTFVVLPEARDNTTLLGSGFINDAGIVLNLPQLKWNFADEPDVHHDIDREES